MTQRKPRVSDEQAADAKWKEWLGSETGQACATGIAKPPYLENRLGHAFMAGWNAGSEHGRKRTRK